MDRVLVASEALLRNGDEEMKNHTHSKLKDLKALWDETVMYIIHCHRYSNCSEDLICDHIVLICHQTYLLIRMLMVET